MRILYLNVSAQLGGAEISVLDMLAGLRGAVPEWQLGMILCEDGPLNAAATAISADVRILRYPCSIARLGDAGVGGPAGREVGKWQLARNALGATGAMVAYTTRLRRAIHDFKPDVVHAHGFKMLALSTWAVPASTPLLWHMHDYVTPRPVMRHILRQTSFRCSAAVANSFSTARDLRSVCGNRLKVFPVYYAVDLERFSPHGEALNLDTLSRLPAAPPDTIRVGLIATMARWKGQITFLRAISMLPESLPIRAYVVGDALYRSRGSQTDLADLRALAEQLGIAGRVGFTGFVRDSASLMRALDVVVHASTKPEPFGLVIAEAMASGRAVVASEAGGAAEILALGKTGLGHPPGNATVLRDRIYQLATNPGLRGELGANGRKIAETYFDRPRLARELIPIYRAAALNKWPSRAPENLFREPGAHAWEA